MLITLGFSTCPNDTYIFDALVHHKIDTEGLEFEIVLADVEELNELAVSQGLDVTKLSYHAYAYVSNSYQLLDSGSALGHSNGPLLISKKPYSTEDVPNLSIAIPGATTTANLLLQIAFPNIKQVTAVLFSEIESKVLSGEYDAGLIIHENRFTYSERGLSKIIDLGAYWEQTTNSPIPLGGIVIRRSIDELTKKKFERVLKRSLEYANSHPEEPVKYMRQYAQEMAEDVIKKHVQLYVNEYSLSLGKEGRKAIETLYTNAFAKGVIPQIPLDIFL